VHPNYWPVKRWRDKKKAAGKCQCGRDRRPDKTKCQVCADNNVASSRKAKFGLNKHQHKALLESQNFQCALCGCLINKSSHIDHNYETGQVRGILCRPCNIAVGYYEKRIAPIAEKFFAYLNPTGAHYGSYANDRRSQTDALQEVDGRRDGEARTREVA